MTRIDVTRGSPLNDDPAGELPQEARHAAAHARRVRVALGREPGDLLLTCGRVVNVFTRRFEHADVVVADGRVAGIAPCVPGFLATVGAVAVAPVWVEMYHYAWFISFGVSFAVYAALMTARPAGPA